MKYVVALFCFVGVALVGFVIYCAATSGYEKPNWKVLDRSALKEMVCSGDNCTLRLENGVKLYGYHPDFLGDEYCLYSSKYVTMWEYCHRDQ